MRAAKSKEPKAKSAGRVVRTNDQTNDQTDDQRLTLRDYAVGDFDALLALDQQCFAEGIAYPAAELNHFIRRRRAFTIVAEDERGALAGFLIAHMQRDYGWIVTIDIRADARRSGLGTRLMAAAEERLRAAGAVAIVLEVAVDNLAAVNFYKRLGYTIIRTIPRYYLDSLDAFQMAKRF
ncbi:MAG: GNAT family N-acetyltransferase [Acidobacteriota bacterium]|nr:GNAT family N-acetyltransferase [Acidobacteriota bacterium]